MVRSVHTPWDVGLMLMLTSMRSLSGFCKVLRRMMVVVPLRAKTLLISLLTLRLSIVVTVSLFGPKCLLEFLLFGFLPVVHRIVFVSYRCASAECSSPIELGCHSWCGKHFSVLLR